jgi:hypothetical protein
MPRVTKLGVPSARLGVSKDVRARILKHDDGARSVTDAVCNKYEFSGEKRYALELWEKGLEKLISMKRGLEPVRHIQIWLRDNSERVAADTGIAAAGDAQALPSFKQMMRC